MIITHEEFYVQTPDSPKLSLDKNNSLVLTRIEITSSIDLKGQMKIDESSANQGLVVVTGACVQHVAGE